MNAVALEMIKYYAGDVKRINHFMKVHGFAKVIGEGENLDENTMFTLETAAYVHDIGIKMSEQKYNSSAGKYQEELGPAEAETMLKKLGFDEDVIKRVSYLVGHHHTYSNIDGIDYQILIEADFIVNIFEDEIEADSIKSIREKIFKTETGKKILDNMYNTESNT